VIVWGLLERKKQGELFSKGKNRADIGGPKKVPVEKAPRKKNKTYQLGEEHFYVKKGKGWGTNH